MTEIAASTDRSFVSVELAPDGTEVFRPNGVCRGPWSLDHCHAGPPTALLARAVERLVPEQRLVRLTVELTRPVPMAGFTIEASTTRVGRTVSTATARILDLDGRQVALANSSHLAAQPEDRGVQSSIAPVTDPSLATRGPFPLSESRHGSTAFMDGVEISYPPGENNSPGPTTLWMRTVAIVEGETPSPFQRVCPLADCGNAISRNAEPTEFGFVNTDLTIHLHREPVGDLIGSQVSSIWNADGIGMSDALLFDAQGPIGRAVQTLLVNRA